MILSAFSDLLNGSEQRLWHSSKRNNCNEMKIKINSHLKCYTKESKVRVSVEL